ncbi:MAG: cysteine desulfurase [Candidatus Nanoarchaeia archaeon]
MAINPISIRKDFPILKRKIHNKQLVYLDSAASSEKPLIVIKTIEEFYKQHYANVHRGLHTLSDEATTLYEDARKRIAMFINADVKETIFVRNATEGINLVARSFVASRVKKGDVILLTEMEHHANIVPWHMLSQAKGVKLQFIPVTKEGILDLKKAETYLSKKPAFFSFTSISNVLGTINPAKELIKLAHKYHVPVLVDACQSVPHRTTDVKDLDCDFLVFSSHKMCGPSGIGILYGKKHHLESMTPFLGGGDMIKDVRYSGFTPNDLPWKFEAGTPNIEGAVGLGAAVDYLSKVGMNEIEEHIHTITSYALTHLKKIKKLVIYGPSNSKLRGGLISFNLGDIHSHDLTTILDEEGVAIRSGHHCAQPIVDKLNVPSVARMSFYLYTTKQDIDRAIKALHKAKRIFKL